MPAVLLGTTDATWLAQLDVAAFMASQAAGDVPLSLAVARHLGGVAPQPGTGRTLELWELLATVGSSDLTVARVLEPHLDAQAIATQADQSFDLETTWGVFAAEGPGVAVTASQDSDGWRLNGTKPWCSLAGVLDRALITAHTEGARRLFSVDLRDPGVAASEGAWIARGLAAVRSESIELSDVAATPVGEDGWYLTRPGFAWGGMGVAAVWFGGAVGIARSLVEHLRKREPDQLGLAMLGETDVLLSSCRTMLAAAAQHVDGGVGDPATTAQRVRSAVSAAAERVITIAGHAMGPAPLALDEEHARRVVDLTLYLRQDHAERDLVRLGSRLLETEATPW